MTKQKNTSALTMVRNGPQGFRSVASIEKTRAETSTSHYKATTRNFYSQVQSHNDVVTGTGGLGDQSDENVISAISFEPATANLYSNQSASILPKGLHSTNSLNSHSI